MNKKNVWHRGSGKTTIAVDAARSLGGEVAVVADSYSKAEIIASRVGKGAVPYSVDDVVEAYESGLPVIVDHSAFENFAEHEWIYPSEWRPLYAV